MNFLTPILTQISTKQALYLIFFFGLILTGSAFFIEHVLGAKPCPMCWWQRYSHWSITVLGYMGIIYYAPKRGRNSDNLGARLIILAIITAIISLAIGIYQSLGQLGWVTLPQSCTGASEKLASAASLLASISGELATTPSCADIGFTIFGLSLAGWNVIIMTSFTVILTAWLIKKKSQKTI